VDEGSGLERKNSGVAVNPGVAEVAGVQELQNTEPFVI
jgi:hypothetical protein